MSGLVDTHAHLMDTAYDVDREAVIARAQEAGMAAMILVGYDLASSRAAVDLARRIPRAWAAVGIHPNSVADAAPGDFQAIEDLAGAEEVVGIGETGLDNYRDFTPPEQQREAFEWHLRLGARLGLPVIVHNRLADSEIAALVSTHSGLVSAHSELVSAHSSSGILHCFSSTDQAFLDQMLDVGYFISFAGPLTFKNASAIRSVAQRVPIDRLLVETDCPYLAPEPHRGRRNEPAFVRDTAACLAEIRGVSLESLTATLFANSVRVFPALRAVQSQQEKAVA